MEPPRDQSRWFSENVEPHEADLRMFLRRQFPKVRDVDDIVQESYMRICHAREAGAIVTPRAYLFTTARNAALDILRRKREMSVEDLGDNRHLRVVEERPDAAESASRSQETSLLVEAIHALPERCREVLTLRRIHGLSYRDIALRLGISEKTVSAQLSIGLLRCRRYLEERGLVNPGSNHDAPE